MSSDESKPTGIARETIARETTYGAYLKVSRPLFWDTRTPEEKAELRANGERYRAAQAAFKEAIDAIAEPHWRAVLDLHHRAREDWPECAGCDFGGYEGESPEWPCRTVLLVAEQCGIIPVPKWGES